ncbi:TPA: protein HyaE [Pasteurella multocida]|uniref:protein HyaE n=1 Tax=Pasteurella multocida TaxID=747 RepID=UPI0028E052E7|nr:protein HyaE [Pasteurella multocida]MDY0500098.1 protein HyaE [Pasteurella multocida]MDY0655463.1 protein HyaE [Pasteurella multocida]WRU40624.1 protein HyaE [Pasteurella multocida]HDR1920408.1 protein HyaE [Pasteurella multocida]HEA3245224.1 protein HyaE [Pasteurella multocida]
MKKVIIIGHKQSNYQDVEKVFQYYGMNPPHPSKREKMSPIEIGDVLNKVLPDLNKAPENLSLLPNKKIKGSSIKNKSRKKSRNSTVKATSLWDNLYLDLVLANIDQEFWGWADPNSLQLLDYWANIDQDIHFVFVYDKPENLFQHNFIEESIELDSEKIKEKLEEWEKYNEKLLMFFNKYKERSVLINSRQIRKSIKNSIPKIYKELSASEVTLEKILHEDRLDIPSENLNKNLDPLSDLIISNVLKKHYSTVELYEKLQRESSLPYLDTNKVNDISLAINAWQEMIKRNKEYQILTAEHKNTETFLLEEKNKLVEKTKEIVREKEKNTKDKKDLEIQIEALQLKLEKYFIESNALKEDNKKLSIEIDDLNIKKEENIKSLKKEIETLKAEIEKNHIENKNLKETTKSSLIEIEKLNREKEDDNKQKEKTITLLKKEDSIKSNELDRKNEEIKNYKIIIEDNIKEKKSLENQVEALQFELEKYFIENKKIKGKPPLWGASKVIRSTLEYQLGRTMIEKSRSIIGFIMLPISLILVYLSFKISEIGKDKNIILHEYQDYYEAMQLKNHLSYKLGEVFIINFKNPIKWILLPYRLYKTVFNFKKK